MTYNGIFPESADFPMIIYPILCSMVFSIGVVLCIILYYALFSFSLQKVIEQLYSTVGYIDHTERSIIYMVIINFPCLVLGISSIMHNQSLTGIEISFNIDELQILILSAYICHLEESRQTPLRGFLFIRDLIVLVGCFGCLIKIYFDGKISLEYGIILLGFYFIYYIMQLLEVKMEESVLELLGLKESRSFNSQYLLSQERLEGNYLEIKEIIEENSESIDEDIQQLKQMVMKVQTDLQNQELIINFAKLVLPYRKAFQLRQQNEISENIKIIQEQWENGSNQEEIEEEVPAEEEINQSGTQLQNMNTLTQDYIDEEMSQEEEPKSLFESIIKYACYPIYLFNFAEGRLFYLTSYLSFFMLIGCMWLISNSAYYFTYQGSGIGFSIITIALAVLLVIPTCRYYIKISAFHDFDFINIFFQSAILKTVIFGITITIDHFGKSMNNVVFPGSIIEGNQGYLMLMIFRIFTFITFGIFMISGKFATHNNNITFLTGLIIASQIIRIIFQTVLQAVL